MAKFFFVDSAKATREMLLLLLLMASLKGANAFEAAAAAAGEKIDGGREACEAGSGLPLNVLLNNGISGAFLLGVKVVKTKCRFVRTSRH